MQRGALEQDIKREEIEQVALLGIGTLGLPRAVAALTWMSDITAKCAVGAGA